MFVLALDAGHTVALLFCPQSSKIGKLNALMGKRLALHSLRAIFDC